MLNHSAVAGVIGWAFPRNPPYESIPYVVYPTPEAACAYLDRQEIGKPYTCSNGAPSVPSTTFKSSVLYLEGPYCIIDVTQIDCGITTFTPNFSSAFVLPVYPECPDGTAQRGSTCSADSQISLSGGREIRPNGTGGNSSAELTARVTQGTTPKAGVAVQFTTEVTANSGGHDHHDASRPKGALAPTTGTTDANGEIKFQFTATQIAGTHSITASCNNCANKTATEKVIVKVPDLVNIFAVPYRDAQWAIPGIGQDARHTDNHYLTVAAATRMLDISRKFQKIWPTAPKLRLNDASLVWGGKLDIPGTWQQNPRAHAEHRVGDNIDIRANTAPGAVPADIRDAVFRWLRRTGRPEDNVPIDFLIESVNPLHEGIGSTNEHFHLRLGN